MKKHKKLLTRLALVLVVVAVAAGAFVYKQKQDTCNSSNTKYPICLGGCNDPAYYKQNIEKCKDFNFVTSEQIQDN
jgi:hypothetical protein